jgi:hypothetical protein
MTTNEGPNSQVQNSSKGLIEASGGARALLPREKTRYPGDCLELTKCRHENVFVIGLFYAGPARTVRASSFFRASSFVIRH